ncbi:MAG: regulatory protein RecX [bacterium]|nr:MAG: regulatory protein RecX [bacterium]
MPDTFAQAMNAACKMLAYRDRSVHEIRKKLAQKRFGNDDLISRVVERLIANGLLDDEKFARIYSESLARNKKVGPRYIKHALAKKGLGGELVQRTVEDLFADPDAEGKEIENLMEKKLMTFKKNLTPTGRKKRVYNFLVGRGFTHPAIMQAINRWDFL